MAIDKFLYIFKNRLVNSYRNTISEWAVVVRYENFFIPRVEKFPYLKTGPFGNPIFCVRLIKLTNQLLNFNTNCIAWTNKSV